MDLPAHEGEIPIPITSTYTGPHGHGHGHAILHDPPPHSSNGLFPSPTTTTREEDPHLGASGDSRKGAAAAAVLYRECLKNHAASLGGKALDGCGEFMPSGADGTLEAFRCSACGCHRNFHRKVTEGEFHYDYRHHHHHHLKGMKVVGQKGVLISASDAYGYNRASNSFVSMPSPHQMIMPLGALQSPEWPEETEAAGGDLPRSTVVKKRSRTKFTPEQKEKMLGFADKVGWRLQKEEEDLVQQFCQEIGVKRRVLKVWMHNNKQNLAKKSPPPPALE